MKNGAHVCYYTNGKGYWLRRKRRPRTRKTVIWILDPKGFPVQKAAGKLDIHLVPGRFIVEFGRGKRAYPIRLRRDSELRQADLEKGPTCKRPNLKLDDGPDDYED